MAERSRKVDEVVAASKAGATVDMRLGDELVATFAGAPGPTRIVVSEARRLDEARRIAIVLGIVAPVATTLMVDRSWRGAAVKMIAAASRRVDEVVDCSLGYGRATMSIDPMLSGRFSGKHRDMRTEAIAAAARIVNEDPGTRIVNDLASRIFETLDYENRWSFARAYRWSSLKRDFLNPDDFIKQPAWADRVIDRKFEPLCLLETARMIAPAKASEDPLAPAFTNTFGFIVDGGWDPVVDGFVRRVAARALAGSYLATERQVRAADEEGWSGCVSVGLNLHERMTRGILYGQQDDLSVFAELRRLPASELARVGMTGDLNVRMRRLGEAKCGIAFDDASIEIVSIDGLADRLIDRHLFGLMDPSKRRGWRPLHAVAKTLGLTKLA